MQGPGRRGRAEEAELWAPFSPCFNESSSTCICLAHAFPGSSGLKKGFHFERVCPPHGSVLSGFSFPTYSCAHSCFYCCGPPLPSGSEGPSPLRGAGSHVGGPEGTQGWKIAMAAVKELPPQPCPALPRPTLALSNPLHNQLLCGQE